MRFAGQRFRDQTGAVGKYRQTRERAEDGSNPYANPTGTPARTNMSEINASSFTKTAQRNMSDSPFVYSEIQQPEFRATTRVWYGP